MPTLPFLHVEGQDDIVVVSNLLARHGIHTNRGEQHLLIKSQGNDQGVLDAIPAGIRANSERPVGFIIDIDVPVEDRWNAVRNKVQLAGVTPPDSCPSEGYIGRMEAYPVHFGVWLMPDCITDFGKMEHLIETLVPDGDVLWQVAIESVDNATRVADANTEYHRFRDVDRKKAEVHTWLSWKDRPGAPLGAAINDRILTHDSQMAKAFLRWLGKLYGFEQLAGI